MLLKHIDETISQGLYDLGSDHSDADVYLVEPSIEDDFINWEIVVQGSVPRKLLHYNDITDGSNKLNGSWQRFYAAGVQFGELPLYSGSSIYFSKGTPNFGGVAKSAIYLRYSRGFLDWLSNFDAAKAEQLKKEIPTFEAMMDNAHTKKMPAVWFKFKAPRDQWPLVAICRLSDGQFLVHWLAKECSNDDETLIGLGIDVRHSRELMEFFTTPETADNETIAEEFQSASGLGRNAFGQKDNFKSISRSEYQRLMGLVPANSRSKILELWDKKLEYRIKVAPSPDTSSLYFLPEGSLLYSELKEFIDNENDKKRLYFETFKKGKSKKKEKMSSEDSEPMQAIRPEILLVPYSTTVYLMHIEGSTKKKRIVQQIFPNISLEYLQVLNTELLNSNLQSAVIEYMKMALTGQSGDTPSVYRYWTFIFTSALQGRLISGMEVFLNLQRFAKSQSGEELIDKMGARRYFQLIGKLLRLQHLIETAKKNPRRFHDNIFQQELVQIEKFNGIKTGVFGPMSTTIPTSQEIIGEAYSHLQDKQKSKLDNFIRQAWAGVPNTEFSVFVHGALTGMLLNELCWTVQQAGRRFSATQGRHPSRLRGEELLKIFDKGIGLLMNLDKAQLFNCRLLPFLKSLEQESRKDTFNSGLITGMVYSEKKSEESNN